MNAAGENVKVVPVWGVVGRDFRFLAALGMTLFLDVRNVYLSTGTCAPGWLPLVESSGLALPWSATDKRSDRRGKYPDTAPMLDDFYAVGVVAGVPVLSSNAPASGNT